MVTDKTTYQVPKDAKEERKTLWADFRCDVWHRSTEVILDPLEEPSHTGYATKCGAETV